MKIAWARRVTIDNLMAVVKCCINLGWPIQTNLSNLLTCIAFETGRTFSPSVKNAAGSGAVGLIQFMPSTAKDLGTTTAALAAMTFMEQMKYVEMYFRPYAKKVRTLEDLYLAIFMPKLIGATLQTIVFSQGSVGYDQNKGFDATKKGYINVFDITDRIRKMSDEGMSANNALDI